MRRKDLVDCNPLLGENIYLTVDAWDGLTSLILKLAGYHAASFVCMAEPCVSVSRPLLILFMN